MGRTENGFATFINLLYGFNSNVWGRECKAKVKVLARKKEIYLLHQMHMYRDNLCMSWKWEEDVF